EQVPAGSCVGVIVNVVRRQQAFVGVIQIARLKQAVTDSEGGSHSSGEIGTDQRACSTGRVDEHRAVANVTIKGCAVIEGIVRLRQSPQVVITDGLGVAVSDANLIVEGRG